MALYDFNLEIARIRETVSDPMVGQLRLKWWYDALDRLAADAAPKHPVALGLDAAVRAGGLNVAGLQRLVEARAADLTPSQPRDGAALAAYAAATSGAIHEAALALLGAGEVEAAGPLSAAWTYVGLMRALPHHAARGWLYLPVDICRAAGLDPASALTCRPGRPADPAVCAAVRLVAEMAEQALAAARQARAACPPAAQPVMLLAVLAEHYLAQLRRAGYDPGRLAQNRPGPGPGAMLRLYWSGLRKRY